MRLTQRVRHPERLRQAPVPLNWLDHRLVREHDIERADVGTWALYLFLVTVADAEDLSCYADPSLSRRWGLDPRRLARARSDRIGLDLITYESPLYPVLSLPIARPVANRLAPLHAILRGRA